MDIIVPKNYEQYLLTKTDQDLARIGHVNRVIEAQNSLQTQVNNLPPPAKSGAIQLLGSKIGFDMNSVSDQLIILTGGTKFVVTDILICNTSKSITTAADFQINDAILRGGNTVFTSKITNFVINNTTHVITKTPVETFAELLIPDGFVNKDSFPLSSAGGNSILLSHTATLIMLTAVGTSLYASLITPEGSIATADVYVYGYILI